MGRMFNSFYLFVIFPHNISEIDAARITKLDINMVLNKSWNPTYFGVKRSKVKVTRYKNDCVGLQVERNINTCCIHQLSWVFYALTITFLDRFSPKLAHI